MDAVEEIIIDRIKHIAEPSERQPRNIRLLELRNASEMQINLDRSLALTDRVRQRKR